MRRLILAFALVLAGCHPAVSEGSGGGGGASSSSGAVTTGAGAASASGCGSDADCDAGDLCVYEIREACLARGSCQPKPNPAPCQAIGTMKACGCDGTEIDWRTGCQPALPNGFAPAPIVHVGACDTQPQCIEDSDCTAGSDYTPPSGFTHGQCVYAQNQGCAARGQCVDPFPMCNSLGDVVGCACDGTDVHMGCGYRSDTYAPKPLAHLGKCP